MHYTGVFVYTNLENTTIGMFLWTAPSSNGEAVGATPSPQLILERISLLTHGGRDVNCCFVGFVDRQLFQPRVHGRLQCHVQNNVYTVGESVHELAEKDLGFTSWGGTVHVYPRFQNFRKSRCLVPQHKRPESLLQVASEFVW